MLPCSALSSLVSGLSSLPGSLLHKGDPAQHTPCPVPDTLREYKHKRKVTPSGWGKEQSQKAQVCLKGGTVGWLLERQTHHLCVAK